MDELRAVAGYAVACAAPALVIFQKVRPDDGRPAARSTPHESSPRGLPARAFKHGRSRRPPCREGASTEPPGTQRSLPEPRRRRHTSTRWRRRRRCATSWGRRPMPPGRPSSLGVTTRGGGVRHHRRREASDAGRSRRARATRGRRRAAPGSRSSWQRLDSLSRPAAHARVVDDPGPFFHGTRPTCARGPAHDRLALEYGSGRQPDTCTSRPAARARPWPPSSLAATGPAGSTGSSRSADRGRPERHRQALPRESDRSYRTTEPLRVLEEVTGWEPPPPEMVRHLRERMGELAELGIEAIDD